MLKLEWETKKVKVSDLATLEINPRKISEENKQKLIESLERFNLVEIPAVNTDMTIVGGNQRVLMMVAVGRGDELIDVRVPNRPLTDQEIKEYAIISNTHAGEFDFELLDVDFSDVDFDAIGFDIPGFDEWEKKKNAMLAKEVQDDDYEVPEGGLDTEIIEGDIIQIGPHRLVCGTSLKAEVWDKLLGEERIDMMDTDPPYNVDYTGKTKDALKIKNDKKKDGDFYDFLFEFYATAAAYTKPGGTWYVWHADSEGANFRKAMQDAGLLVKQCLIWVKNSMVMGRQDYHWQHEPCLYGWKPGAKHNWYSDRSQTTILNFDRPNRNAEHPTMKPVPMIAYQIMNSSKPGDIVGDGFGGSGTTMVACHQSDRVCRMAELDPRYCQVIVDRMIKLDPDLEILKNGKAWNIPKSY